MENYKNKIISIVVFILTLVVWQLCGQLGTQMLRIVPTPFNIINQIILDRSLYYVHLPSTIFRTTVGFLIGCMVGVVISIVSIVIDKTENTLRGFVVVLFSIPTVVFIPILGNIIEFESAVILFAIVCSFYPVYAYFTAGLQIIDRHLIELIKTNGGSKWQIFQLVQYRSSIPSLFHGISVAVPGAFLGVLLTEFLLGGKGSETGIGYLIKSTIPLALPERLWGITFIITILVVISSNIFLYIGNRYRKITLSMSPDIDLIDEKRKEEKYLIKTRTLVNRYILPITILIITWILLGEIFSLNHVFYKNPKDVLGRAIQLVTNQEELKSFTISLVYTLSISLMGMLLGLTLAVLFASIFHLFPSYSMGIMPYILVFQTIPLMVFVPLLLSIFGNTIVLNIAVTISVSFFPSFRMVLNGLQATPPNQKLMVRIYGASRLKELLMVEIPSALPYIVEAINLSTPRVILGAILAECMTSNSGIGGLIFIARGKYDFNTLWLLGIIMTVFSVTLFTLSSNLESIAQHFKRSQTL